MTGRMIRLGNYPEWSSSLSSNFEGLKVDRYITCILGIDRTNHSGTFQFLKYRVKISGKKEKRMLKMG